MIAGNACGHRHEKDCRSTSSYSTASHRQDLILLEMPSIFMIFKNHQMDHATCSQNQGYAAGLAGES
eukprot:3877233-Pleurochrysis_carterae.AAC.1